MKTCSHCKILKELKDFAKNKTRKDGYQHHCKDCQKNFDRKPERRYKKRVQRSPYIVHKKNYCEACGFIALDSCQLDVDHIDENHKNNDISNLRTLCANCHRIKSKQFRCRVA